VVKSINELPKEYSGRTTWVINDMDFDVTARNIIILLIALTTPLDQAVDCMLHFWYSALISPDHANVVHQNVLGLVRAVVNEHQSKPAGTSISRTWTFGSSSCRVELFKREWDRLPAYLEPVENFAAQQALQCRKDISLDQELKDWRARRLFRQPPAHRVGNESLRENGILLPFGSDRADFTIPNL
jgi:hypothetical protein